MSLIFWIRNENTSHFSLQANSWKKYLNAPLKYLWQVPVDRHKFNPSLDSQYLKVRMRQIRFGWGQTVQRCWCNTLLISALLSKNKERATDNYAKDGGPEEVWLLCSFYHDALQS